MEQFDKYVSQFNLDNYDIAYKYYHSYRVQKNSEYLAKALELDDENYYLASIIGLLHDIGRFKQLEEYDTYNDDKSMDHADYGAKVLFEDNVIEKFNVDKKYYKIIDKAIRNHNKLQIEQNLTPTELLHAKIIRDADKIDIFNAYTDLESYSLTSSLGEISPNVLKDFYALKGIDNEDVKGESDKLIQTLSFIFDINFSESLEIIEKNKYLDKLYNQIDNKEQYKKYFTFVKEYMERRMKEYA